MMSWGSRRKLIIFAVTFGIVVISAAWYGASLINTAPSCSDGKLNQGEQNIDCGGPCTRLCENQSKDLFVAWQRAFQVTPDSYNAVAYVENPNPRSVAVNVPYLFQLYDSRNILVAEREGVVSIPPQRVTPIFEGDIKTGNRAPSRVEFSVEAEPRWTVVRTAVPELRVKDQSISDVSSSPLITARIENTSEKISLKNVPIVVIVYDSEGNAQTVSRTLIDLLPVLGSESIVFSWPNPFTFQVSRIEIIPLAVPGVHY